MNVHYGHTPLEEPGCADERAWQEPGARLLVLSSNYPSPGFPTRGRWVEGLVRVAARFCKPVVVSPVPWVPPGLMAEQRARVSRIPRTRRDANIEIHYPRTTQIPIHPLHAWDVRLSYPWVRRHIDRVHRASPIRLIHAHFIYPDGVIAARLGRRYGVPVITTEHANWLPWLASQPSVRQQVIDALDTISLVTSVSRTTAETIRAVAGNRVPVEILPNVVDENTFRPGAGSVDADPDRLLFVGAIRHVKGLDVLIDAMPSVLAERPGAYLDIIGDPFFPAYRRDQAAVKQQIARLGLSDRVRFLGSRDHQGLAHEFRRSAVLAVPSRRESFGSVVVEALGCGTPVVATRCGGPEEILDDALGKLVPVDDPKALADALLDTIGRRSGFDPQRLHDHVSRHYGLEVTGKRLQAIYTRVLID